MIILRFYLESPFTGVFDYTGVPLRAAFLNILRQQDFELSSAVHDSIGVRSYSLDPFPHDRYFRTEFKQGNVYNFGLNLFGAGEPKKIIRAIANSYRDRIRIYNQQFLIKQIDIQQVDLSNMMERWMAEVDENTRLVSVPLRFLTPTQLSQYGNDFADLFPTPEKIFSGLLRVWNAVENSTALERVGEYRDWVNRNVHVSDYKLRTVKVPLGRGRVVVGFIGNVTYQIQNSDRHLSPLTYALARFAEFCNVGKNRTAGLGRVMIRSDYYHREKTSSHRIDERRARKGHVYTSGECETPPIAEI